MFLSNFPSQNIPVHENPIQTCGYLLEILGKSLARHKVLLYDRVNVQHIYEISKSIYQGTKYLADFLPQLFAE